MPNFLVIGAAKAGTTSLWCYLKSHPQIYMSPIKEPKFFAFEGEVLDFRGLPRDSRTPWAVTDLKAYRTLFAGASDEKAVGEASPVYLYSEKAPERIRRHVPDAKLIAVLRNPVERAYSHFLHLLSAGREPEADFAQALNAEEERVRECWNPHFHYLRAGFYHEQLSRYYRLFEQEQIRVYLYEDFQSDPLGVMQNMFGFLGVDDTFVPEVDFRYNVWGIPKSKSLHAFFMGLSRVRPFVEPLLPKGLHRQALRTVANLKRRNLSRPRLSPETWGRLIEEYREDVVKLQGLIERDLCSWLKQ